MHVGRILGKSVGLAMVEVFDDAGVVGGGLADFGFRRGLALGLDLGVFLNEPGHLVGKLAESVKLGVEFFREGNAGLHSLGVVVIDVEPDGIGKSEEVLSDVVEVAEDVSDGLGHG